MRKPFAVLICFLLIICVSSCGGNENDETTSETYVYTPRETQPDTTDPVQDSEKYFTSDKSWQKNFDITYKYFDVSQSSSPATINETKGELFFTAEYLESGDTLFYKQNGNDIDQYILTTKDFTGYKNTIKNRTIDSVSSTFMKLSEVSEELPSLSNVMYMYDEPVAGRMCKKYIQRAYSDSKLTETVFIWIDAEFGFAAKCESYNEKDELTVYWDLISFSTGTVEGETREIDLRMFEISGEGR